MDLDGDGNSDILSGSYSRMGSEMAGLFQVLWRRPDGTFKTAETLNGTDGKPLIIPVKGKAGEGEDWVKNICTRPFAVDWDGNGNLDLVVGNYPGTFYFFKGEGKGKFAPSPEEMKTSDGAPLAIEGHHSDPFAIDWDGDGDLDLLSGSSQGGVQWSENRAGKGQAPQLMSFRSLIAGRPAVPYGQIVREADLKEPNSDTRIWVDDINADGKLDLLVGDNTTLVSPAGKVSAEEFKEKFAEWEKAVTEVSKDLGTSGDEQLQKEAQVRFQKLYAERSKFMKEDRTGFVWLYIQK